MKNSRTIKGVLVGVMLAVGAALLSAAPPLQAATAQAPAVTLIGLLSVDANGDYVLVEEQSGDSIMLRGPAKLADHIGETVKVTGMWVDASEDSYFEVTAVETT
jgi:hypothetical protein